MIKAVYDYPHGVTDHGILPSNNGITDADNNGSVCSDPFLCIAQVSSSFVTSLILQPVAYGSKSEGIATILMYQKTVQ